MSWLKAMMEKEQPESGNLIGIVVIGKLEGDRAHDTPREMVQKSAEKKRILRSPITCLAYFTKVKS